MQDDELNKAINENNINNANNEQLVNPGTYTHINPVTSEATTPKRVPTITLQETPKKSILYRIVKYSLFALFALFLIGSIASLFVDEDASNTQNNTAEPVVAEKGVIDHPVLKKINAELIDKKIVDNRYADGGAVYLPVNDEFNFYITDKSPQNKYLLDTVADMNDAFEGCESENSTSTFDLTKRYFKEANYTVFESSAYAGGYGCTRVQLATNETEVCSLVISDGYEVGPSPNAQEGIIMSVFCDSRENLSEDIALHQEVLKILNETEPETTKRSKEFRAIRDGYIKYNVNANYDIALIVSGNGYESYYYKNNTSGDNSSKWVEVNSSEGINCEDLKAGPQDIYEAFKGQECYSRNENKRIILE